MRSVRLSLLLLCAWTVLPGQEITRTKDVRELAKAGSTAIPKLQELLKSPLLDIRVEAVKQIAEIGTQRSLEPLVLATRDNDPEVQIRATDGLVNFYLPGYLATGLGASLKRAGNSVKSRFSDTNDQVIDPFVTVRPDVVEAMGTLARGGGSMESRANAARSLGILRGQGAVPDLLEALRSKDTGLMYESLIALQKIRDESAGPRMAFVLRDLDPKVQTAAIETTGLLRNRDGVPVLTDVLTRARDAKVRRAALTAIAMLPTEDSRPLYAQYLNDRDEKLRAAAAEGYARLRNPADLPALDKAYQTENKTSPRLSAAFGLVMLGRTEVSQFSPIQYLMNTLNSAAYRGEAFPFLVELARDPQVRQVLHRALAAGTKDEKTGIAAVLARSGDRESLVELQKLTTDPDPEVAREVLRAVRTLQARL
jgi:HEAT repeat protein